ncbi:MAG: capsule assembly Wzi family protein, partial [Pseudomonadota bacterium]
KPTPYLEIGISRAAQTCGEGRRCNFDSFVELLIGNDNRVGELTLDEEPGNQLAGVDFRFSLARYKLPVAVYGQLIGDDEANGLPSRFVGLAGAEWWGQVGRHSLRTYLEVADTQTGVLDARLPDFAYSSAVFPGGFRFNGRAHGHSADGDSLIGTFGAILQDQDDQRWMALVQGGELNRVGNRATPVAADAADYFNVEVSHQRTLAKGTLQISVGYEHFAPTAAPTESGVKGFVQWTWKR